MPLDVIFDTDGTLAAAPKTPQILPDDPIKIARFVHEIPKELLPSWSAHLCSRITDELYEAFKKTTRN